MSRLIVSLILTFLFGTIQIHAQKFSANVALGANISDDYLTETGSSQVGTRMGLNVGPGVSTMLTENLGLSFELLYSQNGLYAELEEIPGVALDKIKMDFLEVPFSVEYHLNTKTERKNQFLETRINVGIAYARLFNYEITAVDGTDLTDVLRFDKEDVLLFHLGATTFFSKSFGVNGKGTLSPFGEWTIALRLLYRIG
ncbi:MAG: outer membrane beta-barrel protein [Bacteroidota bacterium]